MTSAANPPTPITALPDHTQLPETETRKILDLRTSDSSGVLRNLRSQTGHEQAEIERQRAEQAEYQLEQERQRAERLAAQLRSAGIEPDV